MDQRQQVSADLLGSELVRGLGEVLGELGDGTDVGLLGCGERLRICMSSSMR